MALDPQITPQSTPTKKCVKSAMRISIRTGLRRDVSPYSDGALLEKRATYLKFARRITTDSEETH